MKQFIVISVLSLLAFTGCLSAPEGVSMNVDVPESVELGETFDITVTVTNGTGEDHLLTSIDLDTDFLAMAELNSTSPMYTEEWDMHYLGFFSYDYYIDIAAGESMEVVFNMTAMEVGEAAGDLDVCINTESDCMFGSVRTSIIGGQDSEWGDVEGEDTELAE